MNRKNSRTASKVVDMRMLQRSRSTDWFARTRAQIDTDASCLAGAIASVRRWLPDALDAGVLGTSSKALVNAVALSAYLNSREAALSTSRSGTPTRSFPLPGSAPIMDLDAFVKALERYARALVWVDYPQTVTCLERCLEHLWRAQRYTEVRGWKTQS